MRGLLLAVALAAVLAGCGAESETTAPPPATETTTAAREPAPSVSGETLDGETVSLDDFRGRAVFVNVWSSW